MAWYKSIKGWVVGVAAIVVFVIQRWGDVGAAISLCKAIKSSLPVLAPFIAPTLFLLAIIFFDLERRKAKRPNPKILKGKTLLLRDRLQRFLDQLGPMPTTEPERYGGVSQVRVGVDWRDPNATLQNTAIQRARGTNLRLAKIEYGYDLYFATEVLQIYNEFGVRGIKDTNLEKTLFTQKPKIEGYKDESSLREIILALSRLAETREADSAL